MCKVCGLLFKSKALCRQHIRSMHKDEWPLPPARKHELLSCEFCTFQTPFVSRMRAHCQSVHPGTQKFTCSMCAFSTRTAGQLHKHMRQHTAAAAPQFKYPCPLCDYKAAQHWLLVNHARNKHKVLIENKSAPFKVTPMPGEEPLASSDPDHLYSVYGYDVTQVSVNRDGSSSSNVDNVVSYVNDDGEAPHVQYDYLETLDSHDDGHVIEQQQQQRVYVMKPEQQQQAPAASTQSQESPVVHTVRNLLHNRRLVHATENMQ